MSALRNFLALVPPPRPNAAPEGNVVPYQGGARPPPEGVADISTGPSALAVLGQTMSPLMQELLAHLRRFAPTPFPVLVLGETGTGKDLVARAIHEASGLGGPMVACNVAAIAPTLIESELFGHVRGAFSGATGARDGVFRAASRGTLFLDEVGEVPLHVQASMLRVIETSRVKPVGVDVDVPAPVRLVSATHRDLPRMVKEGMFRSDLLYRLAVLTLEVPPLRERREDIPALAAAYLMRHRRTLGPTRLLGDGLAALRSHFWPGNIRELHSVLARAALGSGNGDIRRQHVVDAIEGSARKPPSAPEEAGPPSLEAFGREDLEAMYARAPSLASMAAQLNVARSTLRKRLQREGIYLAPKEIEPDAEEGPSLKDLSKEELEAAFVKARTISALAVQFGVHRSTVREHLQRKGISVGPREDYDSEAE